jgi:acetoin utilization deacetylase AcuC-like enzyme
VQVVEAAGGLSAQGQDGIQDRRQDGTTVEAGKAAESRKAESQTLADQERVLIANIGLPFHSARAAWRKQFKDKLLPTLKQFEPEIILVSAGFDAHEGDPVGTLSLTDADYHWATRLLMQVQPRIVSVLEGGYGVTPECNYSLGTACASHVRALTQGAASTKKLDVDFGF